MKQYEAYLFDIDGTLLDTTELIFRCFQNTCRRFGGFEVSREQVVGNIGLTLRDQMEIYFGKLSDERYDELQKAHMKHQRTIYKDYLKMFPGVPETLQRLKEKSCRIAAVTSRRLESLVLYLEETEIKAFFDVLITPESTTQHKPAAEPALKALEELGTEAHQALFVGDSLFDIKCGIAAGTDTAFVLWSHNDSSAMEVKPTMAIHRISELL